MEIQLIKFVNIMESIFCLHRTISSSTYTLRIVRYLHVFLEFFLTILHGVAHYFVATQYVVTTDSLIFYTSCTNSLALIMLALYKSKKYKQMLKYFNMNHLHLKDDPRYSKNLKIILILPLVLSLVTFVQQVASLVETYRHTIVVNNFILDSHVCDILYSVNVLLYYLRFFFEFSALVSILNLMSEQLMNIVRCVEEFEVVKKGTKPDIEFKEKLKEFDNWCTTYTNVKESSKLFNNIYGLQLTLMVSTIVFYYIIFLYSMTSLSVKGKTEVLNKDVYAFFLLLLIVNLMMLSFAAQRTQNRAEILKRRLSKLLIHSLANEDYYKSTKGFLRLVSSHPIRTEAFGSISVDMSLLPSCVVFFTYYTVTALQFNNIL